MFILVVDWHLVAALCASNAWHTRAKSCKPVICMAALYTEQGSPYIEFDCDACYRPDISRELAAYDQL
jgi:hypothetical protein